MNLFTYGSLMSGDIMEEVSGGQFGSYAAVAGGFQRFCVQGEEYPGMIADPSGEVEGVVYEGIDQAAIERLDIFEGDMYNRQPIRVRRKGGGEAADAMAYVVKPQYAGQLTEEVWSYKKFLERGKLLFTERYVGFRAIEDR